MLSWQRAAVAGLGVLTLGTVSGAPATTADVAISAGSSSRLSAGQTAFGLQIGLDAAGGRVHAAWADNSPALPDNPDRPNLDIAVASIDGTTLAVSPNLNLSAAPASQFEPAIAIDPGDPRFVVAAWAQSLSLGFTSLFVARSEDGGATWVRQNILDGAGEPELGFDSFGNLFVAFIERKNGLETPFPVARLWLSTDHGASFSAVESFPAPAGVLRIALGVGGGAVWTVVRHTTSGALTALGAPVAGRGAVGTFTSASLTGVSKADHPSVALGPDGSVFVAVQNPGDGPATIDVRRDPDGLGPAPFAAPVEVTNYQPLQNDPLPRIAVDGSTGQSRGRVYLVYQDGARLSGTKDVLMRFSDDGLTWTAPFPVNDQVSSVDRLLPNVAVDSSSGAVAVAWYDFRGGGGQAQLRGRVLDQVSPPTTPDAPLNLVAEPASSSEIRLHWTDRSSNETAFEIERFAFGFPGGFARIAVVGPDNTTFLDTAPGSSGLYRIRAINASGPSPYANEAAATPLAVPPTAPTELAATATSATQIELRWRDTSANEQGFKIEQAKDDGPFIELASRAPANATGFLDTPLEPGHRYTYRVRAFNSGGDSPYSATATATTDAPSHLTARALSKSQVALEWRDNKTDESGFRIERSTDLVTFVETATVGPNSTSATVGHLRRGTTYYFRVRAFTAGTTTAYSNVAFAVTLSR
ncbi:MAG TPA: fibronectin type III domain-containing protein [Jiangellaceae bacterium]|nr:fibronectin type III domain-containing protein [Jiangellaceae bacterium]